MPRELASLISATTFLGTSSLEAGAVSFRTVQVDVALGICVIEASGPRYSLPLRGFGSSIPQRFRLLFIQLLVSTYAHEGKIKRLKHSSVDSVQTAEIDQRNHR